MNNTTNNSFELPLNAYAAFDATNLKSLMQQRLNEGGVFTDQIYEGSYFNSLLDVIAYSYNVLLFYLNRTASESFYSQTQIYENMNKIVKSLSYNPVGYQTSVLAFSAVAPSTLVPNAYTIPRFSFFNVNGINYTFTTDYTFIKTSAGGEELTQLMDSALLYQGTMVEYPLYVTNGSPYEQFTVAAVSPDGVNEIIDHKSIFVYVKDETGNWKEWTRVDSLFLSDPDSQVFECRINENQRYTIKFGNNVYGKQPLQNYVVAVYYLKSDQSPGSIGPNILDGNRLFLLNTPQFNTIFNNIKTSQNYISQTDAARLVFSNPNASTSFSTLEDVTSMRNNAANTFKTQYRLIAANDFETFVKTNFGNIISDIRAVNNWDYTAEHMRYLYNIGLKAPNEDSRVLFNQVNFADSCDFNNIYIYVVPKLEKTNSTQLNNNFLSVGLKSYIESNLRPYKMTTSEVVMMDPVYVAVGLGAASNNEITSKSLTTTINEETFLNIGRNSESRLSETETKNRVLQILRDYFAVGNVKLGQELNVDFLTSSILSIEGVISITTTRAASTQIVEKNGLSFIAFNPVYSEPGEDIQIVNQNIILPYFKIPFLYNADKLLNQIRVFTPPANGSTPREY
jgi:hypothetical protein